MDAGISADKENFFLQPHEHGEHIRYLFCISIKTCRVSKSNNEQMQEIEMTTLLANTKFINEAVQLDY